MAKKVGWGKSLLLLVFCHLFAIQAILAQQYFFATFTDKDSTALRKKLWVSEKTIKNRIELGLEPYQFTDMPVKDAYLDSLKKMNVFVLGTLKWQNGCWFSLDSGDLNPIRKLGFVKRVFPIHDLKKGISSIDTNLFLTDQKLAPIGEACLRKNQLDGKGVTIGVVDAGFAGYRNAGYLKNTRKKSLVLFTKDFFDQNNNVFRSSNSTDDHGLTVLKNLVGMNRKKKFGLAPEANLVLVRTENAAKESRLEEVHWAKAMEWLDSLGVRLVNSSLGYSVGFDDPRENYKIENMDGQSTLISKAAKVAAEEKQMIIVTSAGNEGGKNDWRIVTAPADVKWAVSVGAIQSNFTKSGFSSIGPSFLEYVKPDVCAISTNGTSFSAPIITGLIACMLQKKPNITLQEVFFLLERSAHLFPFPNNYVGHGMPDACKILELMKDQDLENCHSDKIFVNKPSLTFSEILDQMKPCSRIHFEKAIQTQSHVIVYYKQDQSQVAAQMRKNINSAFLFEKWDEFKHATFVFPQKFVLEMEWF